MKDYETAYPLFDRLSPSVPTADPNVLPSDQTRLSKKNAAVLRRLQQGPATTIELMGAGIGGIRPGARVFDLIEAGCEIKSERVKDGIALYTLIECPEGLS